MLLFESQISFLQGVGPTEDEEPSRRLQQDVSRLQREMTAVRDAATDATPGIRRPYARCQQGCIILFAE